MLFDVHGSLRESLSEGSGQEAVSYRGCWGPGDGQLLLPAVILTLWLDSSPVVSRRASGVQCNRSQVCTNHKSKDKGHTYAVRAKNKTRSPPPRFSSLDVV